MSHLHGRTKVTNRLRVDETGIQDGFKASCLDKCVDDRATSQGQEQRKKHVWEPGSRGSNYN